MIQERIYITQAETEEIERDINLRRHIERYALARQFLSGKVLDAACGVGYGTFLCQKNPDVDAIVGIDVDEAAIRWANEHFATPKATFRCCGIDAFSTPGFDTLLTIETIEHLSDPERLAALVDRVGISEVIVSFPLKKTTHYNKFHLWDFTEQDVLHIFEDFVKAACVDQNTDYLLMHLVRARTRIHRPKIFAKR
jgi:2-polyprenyl-3-methyl-5-hydroxy-6-metoxy-1,4-benzoquinol methylase